MKPSLTLKHLVLLAVGGSFLTQTTLWSQVEAPPKFVVYATTWSVTDFYQSYGDDDVPQADPFGRKAFKYSYRTYDIVDLGAQVDDGIDPIYPRDVDDNTVFTLSYDAKSKSYFDWDYDFSWTDRQNDGLFYQPNDAIQTRSKIGNRFELREYRYSSYNNNFEYDEAADEILYNPYPMRTGFLFHGEGVVTSVTLPITPLFPRGQQPVVSIPRKLTLKDVYYSFDPEGWEYYDEDLDEDIFVPGKYHSKVTSKGISTYNATITAWVNGLRGSLVDPVSGATLQPGSQAYAGLALVNYLQSRNFVNGAQE